MYERDENADPEGGLRLTKKDNANPEDTVFKKITKP